MFAKRIFQGTRSFHTVPPLLSKLNDVGISKTRNIGIIAHIDAGKTTTTERMLFYSGKTNRIGNVDEGDTVTDYLASERQRGITIQLAAITIPWNSHKINIIDTPGHADFTFEVTRSLRVLDGAVTILDGVAGVEAQTEKVWKQAQSLNIPKIAYVNKMDRPGAGFSRTVKEIIQKLQTRVVLCTIPHFEMSTDNDPVFKGVVDIIHKKLLKWDTEDPTGKDISVIDIETLPEIEEMVRSSRESMIETLGEVDESIIDSFLEHDEDYMRIPIPILNEAIRKATISNYLTPMYCGSSFKNIGVQPLMDAVVNYLPSPLQITKPEIHSTSSKLLKVKHQKAKKSITQVMDVPATMDVTRGLIINDKPNLTVALAFKVMTHATKGVMTFFRVYSGKLNSNTTVTNTRTGKKLLVKKLLLMHGDEPEEVKYIGAGNIGVITGHEDDIITGDTLVSHGPVSKSFTELESNLKLLPIEIPPPLFNSGIEPLTAGDEKYMNECIKGLIREDPSLKVSVDEDLGQTILSGMGELHLDIIKERLVNDMKAKVRLRDVVVSYKESPTKASKPLKTEEGNISIELTMDSFEGMASESLYAEEDGAIVFEQENNIVILEPAATPKHMTDSIKERRWKCEQSLQDLQETLIQGLLTGLQIGGPTFGLSLHSTVVRITSWDYPVEEPGQNSSALLGVGRRGVLEYIEENKSSFGILEPYMETKVYVSSDTLGEVSHDLTHRCQAIITSIEDETTQNLDALAWANDESERVFLPPDYTLKSRNSSLDLRNKKIIVAETPLREMIGYLSRLRSITQGRGTFDMTYIGMRRAISSRLDAISTEMNIVN
ncbi:P-loop containing nucleoside triphosphate hydrolase protein [Suhomyces tanzawaensis NRRL Y-17324]|uniref:Ribosome-releasing factor 2, mitochondrial n=1 Tax=Suhomyces tanzawaensis NRRL Y-17324 TaxID=984487 RepID=A0A1E4SDC7_9ASCO|nr:P-loop containing nucleoside triphosphate hydrolase protein [Suhomyces tanzawaensis NRRL Y-17324]ODV77483.1 P-loop containing nucleoside triphosphate hydrolase protein [Suhomyces tanzawaensis NRRL Y-17324]